ncbi:MAG: TetR/AcrR family transcriptional regulator [Acidobacteriota bacterium]
MKRSLGKGRPSRQAQILETAAQIFCDKGFDGASMGEISDALGMTKAGIYHHVRSKEELLFEIMSYGMDLFESRVLSRVMRIRDPLRRLRATLRGHVLLITRDRAKEVAVILHESNALGGRYRERINRRKRRYVRFLKSTFRDLRRSGSARRFDPGLAAFTMLGMVNWVYQWYRPDGRYSAEQIADALTDLMLRGVLGRGPAR